MTGGIIPRDRFGPVIVLAVAVTFAILVGLAAPCQAAAAKGVHFDPDSPAGKEYALPLARARNEATGQDRPEEASEASAPLFGKGVSGRGEIAVREAGEAGEETSQKTSGETERVSGDRESAESPVPRARFSADTGDGYPVTKGAAMAAAIVLLGGGLGLGLRGLQRVSSG